MPCSRMSAIFMKHGTSRSPMTTVDNKACRQLGALVGWAEQWMVKKSGAGSLDAFGAGSGRDQFQSRHDVIPSSRA
jgi:hypothetical protein